MLEGDILIYGGTVIQPTLNFCAPANVLVKDGKISAVLKNAEPAKAKKQVNAEGCIVTPGLVDFHCHLFNGGSEIGVNPDAFMLPQGVTAAVDQGSSGIGNADSFFKDILASTELKTFAFLNLASSGLTTLPRCLEELNPEKFDPVKIAAILERYPSKFKGLKIRTSRGVVGEYGYSPLKKAREIADKLSCPLVVHTTDAPGTQKELTAFFKKGDVYAHTYQGMGNTILDEKGKVQSCVKEARERGVVFDSADGRDHFRFSVIRQALADGFFPDVISTDLVRGNVFDKAVFGLPLVMSKYINLGMPLLDVVKACTSTPATLLGEMERFGTLLPGSSADIAIMKLTPLDLKMKDVFGDCQSCANVLINKATILNGRFVFEQLDFSLNVME